MKFDIKRIYTEYGSISTFCRELNISRNLFYHIGRKSSMRFNEDSKSQKTLKKLQSLGYVIDEANKKDTK